MLFLLLSVIMLVLSLCYFFFFKQKTAYEMRISDWSSDVCSSDLAPLGYARDLDVLPNTLPPERHLGYAVQWFALALAVLAIAALLTFRKRKPDKTTR